MKILSFGAGMQSTALALMSCENAMADGPPPYPAVPVYDAVISGHGNIPMEYNIALYIQYTKSPTLL